VPSKPGLQASSWGRVLLPARPVPTFNGGVRMTKPTPRFGCVCKSRAGAAHRYMGFRDSVYGNIKVHQAVCEAFHGAKPFEKALVLHEDEDGCHNWPTNLKWGTHTENMNYPGYKLARSLSMRGNTLKASTNAV
jgi:hypothetical protein